MKEKLPIPPSEPGRLWECWRPGSMHVPHRHAEMELNLVLSGRAAYLCGNRRYELGPRSLALLFPGQEHALIHSSQTFRMWILVCRRTFLRSLLPPGHLLLERNPAGDFCRVVSAGDADFLTQLAERLLRHDDAPARRAAMACFLLEAQQAFQRAQPGEHFRDLHPAVENTLRLLREDCSGRGLDEIGKEAGLSASHLSRLFHRQTGITLCHYRNQIRLENFWRIYGNGERTNLLAAALLAGFGSYGQFYRIFRALTGLTPQEARHHAREG